MSKFTAYNLLGFSVRLFAHIPFVEHIGYYKLCNWYGNWSRELGKDKWNRAFETLPSTEKTEETGNE